MYLYQIDKELIVSETKRPTIDDYFYTTTNTRGRVVTCPDEQAYNEALSEWQKNLIPVKEGEESGFRGLALNVDENFLSNFFDEKLKAGIKIPDEEVRISVTCHNCGELGVCETCDFTNSQFAYLNNQPKKEESNEAIEKNDFNLLPKLLKFTNKYNITVQFWTEQTAVFIEKDGIDLIDYGGDFNDTIQMAIDYLNRITKNKLK